MARRRPSKSLFKSLKTALYRYLNPLTGGAAGTGWPFGSSLYKSDIVGLLQQVPGVRYLGIVELFSLVREGDRWVRTLVTEGEIDPGPSGLIASWADPSPTVRSGHAISLKF
jgi:hypothetical protein